MSFFFALVSFFVQLIGEISQAPSTLSFLDKRFRRTRERERHLGKPGNPRNLNQVHFHCLLNCLVRAKESKRVTKCYQIVFEKLEKTPKLLKFSSLRSLFLDSSTLESNVFQVLHHFKGYLPEACQCHFFSMCTKSALLW